MINRRIVSLLLAIIFSALSVNVFAANSVGWPYTAAVKKLETANPRLMQGEWTTATLATLNGNQPEQREIWIKYDPKTSLFQFYLNKDNVAVNQTTNKLISLLISNKGNTAQIMLQGSAKVTEAAGQSTRFSLTPSSVKINIIQIDGLNIQGKTNIYSQGNNGWKLDHYDWKYEQPNQ